MNIEITLPNLKSDSNTNPYNIPRSKIRVSPTNMEEPREIFAAIRAWLEPPL